MIRVAVFILTLLLSSGLSGQSKYWIYFEDEYPMNSMKDSLLTNGITFESSSYWLHAISARLNKDDISDLTERGYIKRIEKCLQFEPLRSDVTIHELGFALEQINASVFLDQGLTGKGVKIGIIDGGFLSANIDKNLEEVFRQGRVAAYKDYLTPEATPYTGSQFADDHHGTEVWQMIAGKNDKIRFGLASDATFYLARTDHGISEKRIEEDFLIEALEWMHDQGVKLINLSLGYTDGYDDPNENYAPQDMNGQSAVAQAVQIAYTEKGMLIVAAAGNDGDRSKWQVVNTPADAKGALAVGASKYQLQDKMPYSSIGPPDLPYQKPDVACFAASGTSFSTPVITGMAASIWQFNPTLSNKEVREIIVKSSSLFPFGNNYLGYGIPDCQIALEILNDSTGSGKLDSLSVDRNKWITQLKRKQKVIVYHKMDGWKVIKRSLSIREKGKLKIRRYKNASQTTIIIDKQGWEIFWMD